MKERKRYMLFAIIMVGMCLRPSITGLGSLLKMIKPDLGLSDAASGMLTTIPVLTFAIVSPIVGKINNRIGTSNVLSVGFSCIALGIVIRSFAGMCGLYIGTILIGAGIACGNVLIPAIIKKTYPQKYGFVTALNSVGLAVSSGLAAGMNYPIASRLGWGWRNTLCIYAVAAIAAIFIWIPVRSNTIEAHSAERKEKNLWKNSIAWSVSLFLGIEALIFYSCSAWLATIFQFKGLDATTAGFYVSCFSLTGIPASFVVPALAGMKKDQRKVTFGLLSVFMLGIVLMAVTSNRELLLAAAVLAGFGCNGGFALSMGFIGFRTGNGNDAMQLSSMSQSIGYLIAAFGPIGMGLINDRFGNWNLNLWLIAALLLVLFIVSAKCAKDETIS